jgi:hypothetical protein
MSDTQFKLKRLQHEKILQKTLLRFAQKVEKQQTKNSWVRLLAACDMPNRYFQQDMEDLQPEGELIVT